MIEIGDRLRPAVGGAARVADGTWVEPEASAPFDESPHAFLRRVTRPWHDRVETAFEAFDLTTAAGLTDFLTGQALALLPIEAALEASGVETLLSDWPLHRRGALLRADLASLDRLIPQASRCALSPEPFSALGTLYVLEGSKLGGRVLLRRALGSPDPCVRNATRFLGHRHDRGWTGFLAVLDAASRDPEAYQALQRGAEVAFAAFLEAAEAVGTLQRLHASELFNRRAQAYA